MKNVTCFLIIIFSATILHAQPKLTCYTSNYVGFGLSFVKINESALVGELRTIVNTDIEDIPLELDIVYRFKKGIHCRFSAGAGFRTNFFTDVGDGNVFLVPLNLEFFPIRKYQNISVITELAPEIYIDMEQQKLRGLIGLRYTFESSE